ncbi:hypothetical protein EDE12_1207 [Methylosinus sp. sav-2]|uniref:hypothetical protein n=1 Tax=unclassified Methylosinus TaxID=2624500 RepID=UPI000A958F7A|nr:MULTISPECIES: hypothetical protein [unclassified Methylosinus]TDX60483.1 hypothetical protein EDE12_1207 [Methylosinus sp. sav-2]
MLMFAGRTDEARQLYLKCRGELRNEDIGYLVFVAPTWEQIIREEFSEFCEVGLHHPLMDEIAAIFLDTEWRLSTGAPAKLWLRAQTKTNS